MITKIQIIEVRRLGLYGETILSVIVNYDSGREVHHTLPNNPKIVKAFLEAMGLGNEH